MIPVVPQKVPSNVRRTKGKQLSASRTPTVLGFLKECFSSILFLLNSEPPSSPLFEIAKEETADAKDEVPFFEEVSATDLLGAGPALETTPQKRQTYSPEVVDLADTPSPFSGETI